MKRSDAKAKKKRPVRVKPPARRRARRGGLTWTQLERRWLKPPHNDPRTLDAALKDAAMRASFLNSRARGENPRLRALAAILHVVAHGTPADLTEVESAAATRLRNGAEPPVLFGDDSSMNVALERMAARVQAALMAGTPLAHIIEDELQRLLLQAAPPDAVAENLEQIIAVTFGEKAPAERRRTMRETAIGARLGEKRKTDAHAIARAILRAVGFDRFSRRETQRAYRKNKAKKRTKS